MNEAVATLNGVDLAFLLLLVASLVVGLIRGLVYELLSLAGWAVAFVAARMLAPQVAPMLPLGAAGSPLNVGVAMVLCFVVTLMVWGILSWLLQKLIQASPLKPVDRALGAVFGLGRGVLVALVVSLLVTLTPLAKARAWNESAGARLMGMAVSALRPALPSAVATRLPAGQD